MNSVGMNVLGNSNVNATNFKAKPVFKGENQFVAQNPISVNNDFKVQSSDVLANYNKGLINYQKDMNVKLLKPIFDPKGNIDEIEGERIYSSDGKLHSIVEDNEDTSIIYKTNPENENEIASVIVKDKATDKIVKKQIIDKYDGEEHLHITEYDPNTDDVTKASHYRNGKPIYSTKFIKKPNNDEIIIDKDYESNRYSITKESTVGKNKRMTDYRFDSNKTLTNVFDTIENGNKEITTDVDFYNGKPINVRQAVESTLPNSFGAEKIGNPDLKPAERFKAERDYKSCAGEKQYYSNDAIEENVVNGVTYKFSPDGDLIKVIDGDKVHEFDGED